MNYILIITVTLLLSAFFSGMEIAFISANKLQLELDKQYGFFPSKIIYFFTKNPTRYIATMSVGNNIALVVFSIFMAKLLEPVILIYIHSSITLFFIQTLISTLLILITAEFLPKAIFRVIPNLALHIFCIPVLFFYVLFYPVTLTIMTISEFILNKVLHTKLNKQMEAYVFGKVDLDKLVQESQYESNEEVNSDFDIKVFQKALDFSAVKVRDCMVPRTEIVAIEENSPLDELKGKFIETGFSKILVYKDTIDNMIGFVRSKDIFIHPVSITEMINPLVIAPETMNANKLLRTLMHEHKSVALVVDEFGGTSGIITTEDIMEEIFGEIEDEHDTDKLLEKLLPDMSYLLSARLEIEYLNETYKFDLPESDEYKTLAGFIFYNLGRIPLKNEQFVIRNFNYKVIKSNNTRIELINLRQLRE